MKRKWRRGCRGAISIFLIIIFVAQYVFCGLLVDGARQKMAEAMAESALDSASTSVLSYYNKLLFDLYGLMGTDGLTEEQITAKLKDYVEKTLGLAEVDPASVRSLVTTVMGAFQAATETDSDENTLDGYDFQIEVSGEPVVTLANTEFVEYQLIEHMKYRAPIYMLSGENGLLTKLKALTGIKDRIQAASDRLEVTSNYSSLGETANTTMNEIDILSQRVRGYVSDPVSAGRLASTVDVSVKDVKQYAADFDRKIEEAVEDYQRRREDYEAELAAYEAAAAGTPPIEPEEPEPWTAEEWKSALNDDFTAMKDAYTAIIDNAATLKEQAESRINDIDTGVGSYQNYMSDLNAKYEANRMNDEENAATVFLPEIELAEANAGQLLKNRPFLTCVVTFTGDIVDTGGALSAHLDRYLSEIAQQLTDSDGGGYDPMKDRLSGASDLDGISGGLNQLKLSLSDALVVEPAQVDVITGAVSGETAKEKVADENPGSDLRDIDEEDLKVEFQPNTDPDLGDFQMDDSLNTDSGLKLLKAASSLVDTLLSLLEGGRDSLYLNQYIVSYFPNYVDNYKVTSGASDMTKKFNEGGAYEPYCANQVEVEYVLTGQRKGRTSVLEVQAMLLGVRTAFNLIAIFTDSAKIAQANAIAAAISGPFAPAVSAALLIGWAVAESVLDVNSLCNGDDVPLLKQGNQWAISVEGAVEKGITAATDYLVDVAADQVNEFANSITGQVKNIANQAVYKAYDKAETSLNAGISAATGAVSSWAANMTNGLAASGESGAGELSAAVSQIAGDVTTKMSQTISGSIDSALTSARDKAALQISKATEKVDEVVNEKVSSISGAISEKLTSSLHSWVSDKIPVGQAVSLEGQNGPSIDMSYMDYMQIFLLLKSNEKKTQRIQQLVQANLRKGGKTGFKMEETYGALKAQLNGSIKFLFMSESIVPASVRQNGRLKFTVNSSVSY